MHPQQAKNTEFVRPVLGLLGPARVERSFRQVSHLRLVLVGFGPGKPRPKLFGW